MTDWHSVTNTNPGLHRPTPPTRRYSKSQICDEASGNMIWCDHQDRSSNLSNTSFCKWEDRLSGPTGLSGSIWQVLDSPKLSAGCLQCLLVLMCLTVCCGLWSPLTVVEELLMMVNNNYSCKMYDNWASKPCTVKVKTLRGSWGTPRGTMAGWWVTILMQQEERRGEGGEPQNM